MKYRISLILVFVLMFNFIFCPYVNAETFSDLDDILAVWDSNIDTSWDTVFNEYKTLDPQTMDKADTVIASNMFRFLMSVGSKPKGKLTQTDYSNFVKATSPFYIAYHGITSAPEVTVHAAWSISSDAFKIFCANVIHNLAQQSTYYDTHVLKNDNFLNDAGRGHLNFIYNDIDNNTEINISNNIFNGFVLSSSSSSIGFYFNPSPLGYSGVDIDLSSLFVFLNNKPSGSIFTPYTYSKVYNSSSSNNYLYIPFISSYSFSDGNFVLLEGGVISDNGKVWIGPHSFYQTDVGSNLRSSFNIANYFTPSFSNITSTRSDYYFFRSNPTFIYNLLTSRSYIIECAQNYFIDYLSPYLVYAEGIKLKFVYADNSSEIIDIPFPSSNNIISPQFVPVNIYNNQVYTSSEDTYWHVDQMVDNIINNDYSTVNNGTDNTFYINNYYVPETVSSGGIQLVTSSSIVYNYTTIINNNGTSSGGSIGSYPYPFDVRIINPEDLQNETELNIKNDILNNYDIDINAGDINSSINIVKDTFNDRIRSVAPSTGGAMSWGPLMFSMIPSDWSIILWSFIIIMAVICVYHHRK